jgi:hypothetical protein
MTQQSHSWEYTQRIATQFAPEAPVHPFDCSAIHNIQIMETTKMPHYRQMDQENVVLVHNGIFLSHEEE